MVINEKLKIILRFTALIGGIILFMIGWGLNYQLVMNSIMELYQVKAIDEMTYNFGLYFFPIVGVCIIISMVIYIAYFQTVRRGITKETNGENNE